MLHIPITKANSLLHARPGKNPRTVGFHLEILLLQAWAYFRLSAGLFFYNNNARQLLVKL